ncbi:hypothetical protein COU57_03440 [Candidatus Pacearchaeota archaeon CG10_big_fil_rev_8_21_14_0_10_32_14]|nr:MAG: hypothetical protein COU57_03440 [Candidatus Pacearchaeota archaeon CG10_big_fil_rev_8_21_14_0_10_32_14]
MEKKSIILDHDIGTNPDDFFALLMLLNSSNTNLKLLVSGNNHSIDRALFAKMILDNQRNSSVESLEGENTGHINFYCDRYIGGFHSDISNNYLERIKNIIDNNEEVVWLVIQGLSNLAKFLKTYPEYIDKFEVIHMGLSINGADEYIGGGTNMESDPLASKYVYELGLKKMKVVGTHTTINDSIRVSPNSKLYKKIEEGKTTNHQILFNHLKDYYQRRGIWPALHDPLTASVALGYNFVSFSIKRVNFDNFGKYKLGGNTQIMVSDTKINNPESFMDLMEELI